MTMFGPGPSCPPCFSSFTDWSSSKLGLSCPIKEPIIVHWPTQNVSLPVDLSLEGTQGSVLPSVQLSLSVNPDPLLSNTNLHYNRVQTQVVQENPFPTPPLPSSHHKSTPTSNGMAFQRPDPSPFMPHGPEHHDVQNRQFMVHAVAQTRPAARHENWAIVNINPLSVNALDFDAVSEVLKEFFAEVARVLVHTIQHSHLGQAIVQFERIINRDTLFLNSPYQFGDVSVSFFRHNQGRNWRRVQFNREC